MLLSRFPRKAVLLATFLFLVTGAMGFFGTSWLKAHDIQALLRTVAGSLSGLSPLLLFMAIFLNNAIKALAISLGGIIFGILPAFFVVTNGFLLGFVIHYADSPMLAIAALVPHGVIEIPAVLLAAGAGLSLGARLWSRVAGNRSVSISDGFTYAVRVYVVVVVPALLVAAAIEAFITPWVIQSLGVQPGT
ncbi:MAG: stage II sporulation protein M [Chloroflexi bacterium]|nr:stage II sporulation protein M [Chloroflexota bacterium]